MFIQLWMAKTKKIESKSRIISNYNVRNFILDLDKFEFFYTKNLLFKVEDIQKIPLIVINIIF